jgi:nucleotide-binding universal stress UspA family protein
MKKILLAFDGSNLSKGVLEFARVLNEKEPILLTGAFLAQVDYTSLWGNAGGGMAGAVAVPLQEGEDSEGVKERVRHFESYCVRHHIEHRVHKDFNDFAMPELKKETRFADLLIVGSETFYENDGTKEPNVYLKELLYDLECPVVIVPESLDFPSGIILAYDGSESSVYAIKQFAYLFPELCDNNTILVYAKDDSGEELPDEANIEELVSRHFSNLTLLKLLADPRKYFGSWLMENKGCILVSGAFGRSGLSRLFRKSFVSGIIGDHKLPVFIAHK